MYGLVYELYNRGIVVLFLAEARYFPFCDVFIGYRRRCFLYCPWRWSLIFYLVLRLRMNGVIPPLSDLLCFYLDWLFYLIFCAGGNLGENISWYLTEKFKVVNTCTGLRIPHGVAGSLLTVIASWVWWITPCTCTVGWIFTVCRWFIEVINIEGSLYCSNITPELWFWANTDVNPPLHGNRFLLYLLCSASKLWRLFLLDHYG